MRSHNRSAGQSSKRLGRANGHRVLALAGNGASVLALLGSPILRSTVTRLRGQRKRTECALPSRLSHPDSTDVGFVTDRYRRRVCRATLPGPWVGVGSCTV